MILPQRSILITGAHGRLPTAFLNRLKTSPHRVLKVTRNPRSDEFGWEDLLEGNLLESATDILYFAWSTVPYSSEQTPGTEWTVDLPSLARLLLRVAERGPSAPRFIFISSGGTVYGDAHQQPSHEEDALFPRGWHGFAKVAAESLVRKFGNCGVNFTILRPSNIYGFPVHFEHPQGLIPHLLEAVREKKPIEIWGDGTALKDYLHVDDFVVALGEIVSRGLLGTFNIAKGESHSVSEVIRTVEEITGIKARITYCAAPEWDVRRSLLSRDRLSQRTSWQPTVSLYQGIYSLVG